jgi:MacB-like periplasmic core domain
MPDWAPHVRARLASLRLSPTRETEIVDELSQHLEDRCRELIAGGTSPDEATRLALADFQSGNILGQKMASLRQAHVMAPTTLGAPTGHVVSDLWQDVRYAARIFWKLPAFAATALLTLALGIGATTAIFSVVYGVLLKPLPFHEADRLVSLRQHAPHGVGTVHGPATYLTYRENQQAFEAIGAWNPAEVSITGGGDPQRVQALLVSATTLPLLRVQPVVGRLFSTEDDTPGNPLRVVLTYGYWQRRFGGAANIVGQTLAIDGRPAEVIGVLPASFTFLRTRPEIVLPMPLDASAPRHISFGFRRSRR